MDSSAKTPNPESMPDSVGSYPDSYFSDSDSDSDVDDQSDNSKEIVQNIEQTDFGFENETLNPEFTPLKI